MSAVRWVSGFGSAGKTLPSVATLVVECIFSLSGLANVIIFLFTRSDLRGDASPLPPANSHSHPEPNTVELSDGVAVRRAHTR
jgi:hypothetical protein